MTPETFKRIRIERLGLHQIDLAKLLRIEDAAADAYAAADADAAAYADAWKKLALGMVDALGRVEV